MNKYCDGLKELRYKEPKKQKQKQQKEAKSLTL